MCDMERIRQGIPIMPIKKGHATQYCAAVELDCW
jgi:hypothetical protein